MAEKKPDRYTLNFCHDILFAMHNLRIFFHLDKNLLWSKCLREFGKWFIISPQ